MTAPKCLVIIPDGNRRWARAQNYPETAGHGRGLINCRTIVKAAFKEGVQHVVLWGASESNLQKRDPNEIAFLYGLLKAELLYRLDHNKNSFGFRMCGVWQRPGADLDLLDLVDRAQKETAGNTEQVLTLLFGYSGETELVHAAQRAAALEDSISHDTIRKHLWTAHVPEVDLVIRTGVEGDPHWSDLLLPWQMKNAQLYFSDVCWPAFNKQCLRAAFDDYSRRVRRRGS